jgi:hypothetical protein
MHETLKAVVNGQEYTWEVEISASQLVIEAARKGFQEWLQDAASTVKPTDAECKADPRLTAKDSDPEGYKDAIAPVRARAVHDRLTRILDGLYSPGSRGPSTSFTSEQDKVKGYVEAFGFKWPRVETSGTTKSGKSKTSAADFATGWKEYTQSVAKKNGKTHSKEFQDAVYQHILKLVNTNLDGMML